MLLQLSKGLAVISTIGHQGLITSSAHRVEELFQGPWHLHPVIILEGLVQDRQHLVEAVLVLDEVLHVVFHLFP